MTQEAVDSLNNDTAVEFKEAKNLIFDSYFQFSIGLAAVIAMIVYPVIFQFYGIGSTDGGINWFPPASMVATAMAAVLIFAWTQRFKSDRSEMENFKNNSTKRLQMIADAFTRVSGDTVFEVDESGKSPKIIHRERTLNGNLLD